MPIDEVGSYIKFARNPVEAAISSCLYLYGVFYFEGAMKYSDLLADPRWQKRRLEILTSDNWTCRMCGDKKSTLHIHHIRYSKNTKPWEEKEKYLVTICRRCHEVLHEKNMSPMQKVDITILVASFVGGEAFLNVSYFDIADIILFGKYDRSRHEH